MNRSPPYPRESLRGIFLKGHGMPCPYTGEATSPLLFSNYALAFSPFIILQISGQLAHGLND